MLEVRQFGFKSLFSPLFIRDEAGRMWEPAIDLQYIMMKIVRLFGFVSLKLFEQLRGENRIKTFELESLQKTSAEAREGLLETQSQLAVEKKKVKVCRQEESAESREAWLLLFSF